jgi:Mn2+/Fe2+ NRAMP family transporter
MTEPTSLETPSRKPLFVRFLAALGPAIITASVVLGPGSILTNSKTGAIFGYQMAWVLVIAVALMIGMTALSTRLGVLMDKTIGEEIAQRAGRLFAILVGATIFLVASCFQFSNNTGVLAAFEPFLSGNQKTISLILLTLANATAISALLFARDLYRHIETLMKILVGLMVVGFIGNLILARPSISGILSGFVPSVPDGSLKSILPIPGQEDVFRPVVAMIGTTFSIAAAYYQSYLVQQKGWTKANYRTSVIDTLTGIGMLGLISLVIMCTASAAFHGKPIVSELQSAADFATQLEPTFGTGAKYLFCAGIFAGAISSFLVNALIGGAMLSDGCGFGGRMEQRGVRICTVLALLIGYGVAVYMVLNDVARPVNLIIFAQSVTVLGGPLIAIVLIWLATRPDLRRDVSTLLIVMAVIGMLLTLFVALRTAIGVYIQLTG